MAELKTVPTNQDVVKFLTGIPSEQRCLFNTIQLANQRIPSSCPFPH